MVHLRVVSPPDRTDEVLEVLERTPAVINIIVLEGVAHRPDGDVVMCDVAREDASVIISDLRHLGIDETGSITLETVDLALSRHAQQAERHAAGAPADAVVWEEVEQRTNESVELSGVFLVFMVLAALLSAVSILLDSAVLLVGAMVVGPEFGPIAGVCVALVRRERRLALRSGLALAVGFPLAIAVTFVTIIIFKETGISPATFTEDDHELARIIASPDFYAAFVAVCAGAAGVLSLSTAKSGALIGVLISVTTLPAAANVGLAAAYQDWEAWRGSFLQLGLNLACILTAGTTVLAIQRLLYRRRRHHHLRDEVNSPRSERSARSER